MLHALAEVSTPALARRAAALVGEYIDHRPDGVAQAAAYVDRRLEQRPPARAALFPLFTGLRRGAFPPVLAASGSPAPRLLRVESSMYCWRSTSARNPELAHRTGLLLVRPPEGATCYDRRLVEPAREVPDGREARQSGADANRKRRAWQS
ncbi:hypothetical protein AB0D12_25985 [Streptomyces sp. NPDC048479]|uniref:hypothetical protein n=1 Tax=Streptomyces sp. NPDC048479 TaxID=3154725 RepID=UPI00343EB000